MYDEIYKGVLKLFREKKETDIMDMGRIPHFFSLLYGFDPTDIEKVVNVKLKGCTDLVLVSAHVPNGNPNIRYSDIGIFDGKVKKVVLFNLDSYMDSDITQKMYSICWSVWETSNVLSENYIGNFLNTSIPKYTNFSNIVYYAPFLLMVKLVYELLPIVNLDTLSAILTTFYKKKVYPESIISAKNLLDNTSVADVLDNSLWLAVNNNDYPYIRFDEIDEKSDSKEDTSTDESTGI